MVLIILKHVEPTVEEYPEIDRMIREEDAIIIVHPNPNIEIEKTQEHGKYYRLDLHHSHKSRFFNFVFRKRILVSNIPGLYSVKHGKITRQTDEVENWMQIRQWQDFTG